MSRVTIDFAHDLNATVYVRSNGAVRKGVVMRQFWKSVSAATPGRELEMAFQSYAIRFVGGPPGEHQKTDAVGAQFVFANAEDAFACMS